MIYGSSRFPFLELKISFYQKLPPAFEEFLVTSVFCQQKQTRRNIFSKKSKQKYRVHSDCEVNITLKQI